MTTLEDYGWNEERAVDWQQPGDAQLTIGRIVTDHGSRFSVATPVQLPAQLSGASIHKLNTSDMPKIGDWVAIEPRHDDNAIIHDILPRSSEVVRGVAGNTADKQILAANVDLAFIMQPLDHDFSPHRLERYLFQLTRQNISAVILLNKADAADDITVKQTALAHLHVPILTISALHDTDLTAITRLIAPGKTAVILGSSGAGKSTLTNRLLGEHRQATQAVRAHDSKGRHTTVHRSLFLLPGGGMIIDTPGIRELQLWGTQADLASSFPDIVAAAAQCHYPHCTHTHENRCAIKEGLQNGTINQTHYQTYLTFAHELQSLALKQGLTDKRRSQKTHETAKRRQERIKRQEHDHDNDNHYFM